MDLFGSTRSNPECGRRLLKAIVPPSVIDPVLYIGPEPEGDLQRYHHSQPRPSSETRITGQPPDQAHSVAVLA